MKPLSLLLVTVLMASHLAAQGSPPNAKRNDRRNRERWENLDEKQRRRIRKFYRRLESLPPEERKALLRRYRDMSPEERRKAIGKTRTYRRFWKRLSPKEREKFKSLSPDEKRQYVKEHFRKRQERLIEELPPDLQERARKLSGKEQGRFIRKELGALAAKRTFQDPEELEALRRLPPQRVARTFFRHGEQRAERSERPDFLSEETWARWQQLKPYEKRFALRHVYGDRLPWREGRHGRKDRKGHRRYK